MKKTISILCIFVLCFSLFTVTAFAEQAEAAIDITKMSKEELDTLALAVFPEYESDIKCEGFNPNAVMPLSVPEEGVVYSETRAVSDGLFATIVKLWNGVTNVIFEARGTINDSTLGSGYANRVCTYTVTCYISHDVMIIEDFEYTVVHNGYDAIGDLGNGYGTANAIMRCGYKMNETASGPAYVEYSGYFTLLDNSLTMDMGELAVVLRLEVGNDQSTSILM